MIENEDWEPTGDEQPEADRSGKSLRAEDRGRQAPDGSDRTDNQGDDDPLEEEHPEEAPVERYSEPQKMRIFDKEFLPHIDAMYNFAYRLTFDEDDAKDLVQETYLKAFRFINSFEEGTNAKAWLFRILKNSFINDYRKKSKEPAKVDYNDVESYYNSEDAQVEMTTDLRVESLRDMIGDEVSNALNSLAVDFRTVIILCDLEGFTYEEMAKILDIPIGTVRSRLHRARNLLKDKLRSYAKSMGY
jgi:RNA polymerase sigma factor (sigma-70 family)